jgi:hypothetical protein
MPVLAPAAVAPVAVAPVAVAPAAVAPVAPVAPTTPTVNDVGTMRSDGNEWLEYPEASGAWYARDAATRQWIRKI